jgi:hypothetical protein
MQVHSQQPTPLLVRVPVHLVTKSVCNLRHALDENQVQNMIRTLQSGQWLPHISIRQEGNVYGCYDGIHRLEAYRRCGFQEIPAYLNNVSDIEAYILSFQSGSDKTWTEAEKSITCLKLYQNGKSVAQIKTLLPMLDSESSIRNYIKIGAFLNKKILHRVQKNSKGGGIALSTAIELCDASEDDQLRILEEISKMSGTKSTLIKELFRVGRYQKIDRNISNLFANA